MIAAETGALSFCKANATTRAYVRVRAGTRPPNALTTAGGYRKDWSSRPPEWHC